MPSPAPAPAAPAGPEPAGPGQGKWRVARAPVAAAGPSREDLSHLLATPYLQGYRRAEDRPTVLAHDRAAVSPGLNLYTSGHAAEAFLTDMDGRVLHRWAYPLRRLWPDLYEADPEVGKLEYWRRAYLYPNGDLLAIYEGLGLVKLDRRSSVLWAHRGGFHHDLFVTEDGRIFVLDRDGKVLPRLRPEPVLEDFVTVLAPDGRVLERLSLLESFERSPAHAPLLRSLPRGPDLFHTNTLEVLDGRFAARSPAFRAGNLLVSVLQLGALAIVDPRERRVVWARQGSWRKQHQPTFLDSGRLLLFDNLGAGPDRSRVIELDPLSGEIAWQFGGDAATDFFSKTLGSCQRLPGGNTLITESENGRALEVTPEGRVVWEFYNPQRAGEKGELVAVLFEVVRLPPGFPFRGERGEGPQEQSEPRSRIEP
jgi:hypothetical protein